MGNSKQARNLRFSLIAMLMREQGDIGSNSIIASAKKFEDYILGTPRVLVMGFGTTEPGEEEAQAPKGDSIRFEEPTDGIVMKHTGINSGQMDRANRTATEQAFQGVDNRETRSLSDEKSIIEKANAEHSRRLSQCRMIFSQGISTALLTKNYGPQMNTDRIIERIVRVMNTGVDDIL